MRKLQPDKPVRIMKKSSSVPSVARVLDGGGDAGNTEPHLSSYQRQACFAKSSSSLVGTKKRI